MTALLGALFVDGANVAHQLSKRRDGLLEEPRIHWPSLEKVLRVRCSPDGLSLVDWRFRHYYCSHRTEADQQGRGSLNMMFSEHGWIVIDTQSKQYGDGHFEDKQVDIEIAIDAYHLALLDQVQVIALVTHDSDFAALARKVREFRPKVQVFAVGWTDVMGHELIDHARVVPMQEIWNVVRMRP
jgi:uncharacterized LabA/DUF88 family protein